MQLEIIADDIIKAGRAKMQSDREFALEVKCMALIRMLEAQEQAYAQLLEQHHSLQDKRDR